VWDATSSNSFVCHLRKVVHAVKSNGLMESKGGEEIGVDSNGIPLAKYRRCQFGE
jgi:hypothetical protein